MESEPSTPRPTKFPDPQTAAVMLDALPVSYRTAYRLHRGPDGKCEIEVFQMTGWL
ncbi:MULTISPECIES: hypothetical protein [Rhodomicrobium]|uniref:hypothetical protein n=1 Tax=Rhodomicrobium TaxID=1068 RepID=UPI00148246EE|nr:MULTISPECIES: hypothetical protein [Rhodomicrobium]